MFGFIKVKYHNDDKYKGNFKDGRQSGYGEMKYFQSLSSGQGRTEAGEYKGMWQAGKRHGQGVMIWDDGSKFEGLWNADERVFGIMKMSTGQVYVGKFKNDLMDGFARLFLTNGIVFIG